ncbi:hypothetical protein A2395_00205 [Candidatus Amesbacteria bacterium RIFOXYB1_FULL_47_9]|uniref:Membrane protein 6-pyruvoyl-tetrahydropterin synthase-related domain-containing protein n=1 Tax=Candidatus Amesbacteria bacterium RIFOXYB1_FULL_47_9 TaxID=1797266 RepID=A0A1F4ZUU4_9BACT|nr:MAG: hypothetical protein A2395_00205 [Candidatus Amesbacteria bacterium RIFOXYB1_FULL_47_9]
MNKSLLLFAAFAVIAYLPFLRDDYLARRTDLQAKFTNEVYLKQSILREARWPQWNPLINQGVPISEEPLSDYLNPLMGVAAFFPDPEAGVKTVFIICLALSGLSMYLLAREAGISKQFSLIIGLTYEAAGYTAGQIQSGHAEKILSYPLLPLFLLALWRSLKRGGKWPGAAGILWGLILYSGEVYNLWYAGIALAVAGVYALVFNRKRVAGIIAAGVWAAAASAAKLLPYFQSASYLQKVLDPFSGSQNAVSFIYHLFLPLSGLFKAAGWWNHIPGNFGWWEKAGFIGPVWITGLILSVVYRKKIQLAEKWWWIGIGTALVLLAMPGWTPNPYRYLISAIPQLSGMHVPSRIFGMLSIPILLLGGKGIQTAGKKYSKALTVLLMINLAGVLGFQYFAQIKKPFSKIEPEYDTLINQIGPGGSLWQDANINQVNNILAAQKDIRIFNSNYGYSIKDSPATKYWKNEADPEYIPDYALVPADAALLPGIETEWNKDLGKARLYKLKGSTPLSSTGKAKIKPDEITVSTNATLEGKLTVYQSYYPGWSVYRDGERQKLIPGRFLETKLLPGKHKYIFRFFSVKFTAGLMISWMFIYWWSVKYKLYKP